MLFKVNFKQFVLMKFAEIRRLPKWVAFMNTLIRPFEVFYVAFLDERIKNIRRRLCDGSVISLKKLIKSEFDVDIEFVDSNENYEIFLSMVPENEISKLSVGTKTETTILAGCAGDVLQFDYIVEVPSATNAETMARIGSVLNIYNSAGYNFKIVKI